MADRKSHPIFDTFPIEGTLPSDYGKLVMPYRVYDGFGALIGGSIDPVVARRLMADEKQYPVLSTDRRALAFVRVCNFTESGIGAHTELQLALFTADKPRSDIPYHPFGLLQVMAERSHEIRVMTHRIWHNSDKATLYHRHVLGLRAAGTTSAVNLSEGAMKFTFSARLEDGEIRSLCAGKLIENPRMSLKASWDLKKLTAIVREPLERQKRSYLSFTAINPISDLVARHRESTLAIATDQVTLREWDPEYDQMALSFPDYADADFQPDFVQRFDGIRFVYATPRG
jgi:hypothetical protein